VAFVQRRVGVRVLVLVGFGIAGLFFTGCDWFSGQPDVDFTFTPGSGNEPLVVDFAPVLEGAVTGYLWDFERTG
jgi:PKD repeat protein